MQQLRECRANIPVANCLAPPNAPGFLEQHRSQGCVSAPFVADSMGFMILFCLMNVVAGEGGE